MNAFPQILQANFPLPLRSVPLLVVDTIAFSPPESEEESPQLLLDFSSEVIRSGEWDANGFLKP